MSENISEGISNDQPFEKDIKFSSDDLSREISLFENKEIKTGISKCKNASFFIDEEKIDLLNINSEKMGKINFDYYPSINAENGNVIHPKMRKSSGKYLDNDNLFLNNLGQSITSKLLGENYQAIPYKFVIYEKYDFRHPRSCHQEESLKKLLIIVCPTNCKGGIIHFPQSKKKFTEESDKILSYVLFDIKTQYQVSQVIEGLRVLIIYKIYENCFQLELKSLTDIDQERLKTILKNMTEKNILIPMTEGNIAQKICDDIKVKYERVYSDRKYPKIVYSYPSEDPDYHPDEHYTFKHLIHCSAEYSVGTRINLPNQLNSEQLSRYCIYSGAYSSFGMTSKSLYYCFILINPCRNFHPTK